MDVFEFDDYRELVRTHIASKPKNGFGQLSRLARHLGVNATFVSQILAGTKNLSEEQAHKTSEFLELTEPETLFFLLLVQRERAGTRELKALYEKQIHERRRSARQVRGRITTEIELSATEQAVYYSDWLYTAVHTLSSIERFATVEAIAETLGISRARISAVATWLIEHGLCLTKGDRIAVGPRSTYVDRDSPLAARHHANWRLKAIERMQQPRAEDFFFTAPFSISVSDYQRIRDELSRMAAKVARTVEKTDPEVMATISIDLFRF